MVNIERFRSHMSLKSIEISELFITEREISSMLKIASTHIDSNIRKFDFLARDQLLAKHPTLRFRWGYETLDFSLFARICHRLFSRKDFSQHYETFSFLYCRALFNASVKRIKQDIWSLARPHQDDLLLLWFAPKKQWRKRCTSRLRIYRTR